MHKQLETLKLRIEVVVVRHVELQKFVISVSLTVLTLILILMCSHLDIRSLSMEVVGDYQVN